jgi:hypothetical protein
VSTSGCQQEVLLPQHRSRASAGSEVSPPSGDNRRDCREESWRGYRRISQALRQEYRIVVNEKLLKRQLRLWGLQLRRTIHKPARGYVYRLLEFLGRRANLLFRFKASSCLEVVVSDVTELIYRPGKAYLAVHLDQFGKLVLG